MLQERLEHAAERAQRSHAPAAVLFADLDGFKRVNDTFGHHTGDALLVAVAARLSALLRPGDTLARVSGDEFVILCEDLDTSLGAELVAKRIAATLGQPFELDGHTLAMTASVGLAFSGPGEDIPQTLLRDADLAMYQAKLNGGGHHQVIDQSARLEADMRKHLERDVRAAVLRGQFQLAYQPIIAAESGGMLGVEALLRWEHPERGWVSPEIILPIAERTGMILPIGEWVLRTVCLQLSEWQRQHVPLLPVSVNISVRQFEHTQLANVVAVLADELGIDASLLHFEITESAAMQNSQQHLGSLQALRNLGSRILIDDFGTGYSSLSYLKHLPIDTLKIDRAFVRDMAVDANDAAIVRAIVGVAKSLGLQLVAEGIETAEQLECLRKLDCECGQGFYFSPPVSAESCRAMLWQLRGPPRVVADNQKVRMLAPTT